jgi:hypothetical protein
MDGNNQLNGQPLATIPKKGTGMLSMPPITGGWVMQARHPDNPRLIKMWRRGGYGQGEHVRSVLKGPGKFWVKWLDTEPMYDILFVCGTLITGNKWNRDPILIPPGDCLFRWTTDISNPGDGFHVEWLPDNLYEADVALFYQGNAQLTVIPAFGRKLGMSYDAPKLSLRFVDATYGGALGGTPPSTKPRNAYVDDTNMRAGYVQGNLVVNGTMEASRFNATLIKKHLGETTVVKSTIAVCEEADVSTRQFDGGPLGTTCVLPLFDTIVIPHALNYPVPRYYLRVAEGNHHGFNTRDYLEVPVVDVDAQMPVRLEYTGDFDGDATKFSGSIKVFAPKYARGLSGYRAYAARSDSSLISETPLGEMNLDVVCPPRESNTDYLNATWISGDGVYNSHSLLECDNPFAPKCSGPFCHRAMIWSGDKGQFFISRAVSLRYAIEGNQIVDNDKLYLENEFADIYFPVDGKLVVKFMDLEPHSGDQLLALFDTNIPDIGTKPKHFEIRINPTNGYRVLRWMTDATDGGKGWTLEYQPDYPSFHFVNQPLPDKTHFVRVVPVYHGYKERPTIPSIMGPRRWHAREAMDDGRHVRINDWILPNVTCTAHTIRCPVPERFKLIDYQTTSNFPLPKYGQCKQIRSVENGTYFEVERQSCGSTRTFLREQGLIRDSVTIVVNQTQIPSYLTTTFYTPPPPITPGGSAFLVNNWEEGGPLLPPTISCNCDSADTIHTGKLSLEPTMPVLPTSGGTGSTAMGKTAIVAYLRLFRDPAYSLEQKPGFVLPDVITRYYLEISTEFNKNKVQVRSCMAAPTMGDLAAETDNVQLILGDYCEDQRFEIRHHMRPRDTTHIHRFSMRKFQFKGSNSIYFQCVVEACESPPCGECQTKAFGDKAPPPGTSPNTVATAPPGAVYSVGMPSLDSVRGSGQRAGYGRRMEDELFGTASNSIVEFDTSHLPRDVRRHLQAGGVAAPTSGSGFMETQTVTNQIGRAMTPMLGIVLNEFDQSTLAFEAQPDYLINPAGATPSNQTLRVAAAGNSFEGMTNTGVTASGGALMAGRQAFQPYVYKNATAMPFVMSTTLTFSTLTVQWVGEHRRALEATLIHILRLNDTAVVNIMDVLPLDGRLKARRVLGTSSEEQYVDDDPFVVSKRSFYFGKAPRRKFYSPLDVFATRRKERTLAIGAAVRSSGWNTRGVLRNLVDDEESLGVRVDFNIGLPEDLDAAKSLHTALETFARGDVQTLRSFVTRLDRELVTRGGYPKRLSPTEIGFLDPKTEVVSHEFLVQVMPWFSTSTTTTTINIPTVAAEKPFLDSEVASLVLLGGGGFLGVLATITFMRRLKMEHSNRKARKMYGGKHLVVDMDYLGGGFERKVAPEPERGNDAFEDGSPSPTSSTGSGQRTPPKVAVSPKKIIPESSSSSSSSDSEGSC